MSVFDPSTSLLAGMATSALEARLAQLQAAYLDLSAGAKAVSVSYTQNGQSKSVTYTSTNLAALTSAIRQLQAQLGLVDTPRRSLGVRF